MNQTKSRQLRSDILDLAIELAIVRSDKSSAEYKIAIDDFYTKLTNLLKITDEQGL